MLKPVSTSSWIGLSGGATLRRLIRWAPLTAVLAVGLAVLLIQTLPVSGRVHDAAPVGLTARAVDGGVALSWEPPRDRAPAGYRILRRHATGPAKLSVLVADTASAETGYIDRTARSGTGYVYRVQPAGAPGADARSNYARGTTPSAPFLTPPSDRVTLPPAATPVHHEQIVPDRQWSLLRGTASTTANGLAVTADTFWAVNDAEDKVYAYGRSGNTVTYDMTKDFDLHSDNDTQSATFSDGTTLWIGDSTDDKIYGYTLPGGTRDADKDITGLDDSVVAIVSDGTTMWACDAGTHRCLAYLIAPGDEQTYGQRVPEKDFQQVDPNQVDVGEFATDGATTWLVSGDPDTDDKLHAYALVADGGEDLGVRTEYRDIVLDAAQTEPDGAVFEDGHVYVANSDEDANNVYAYAQPDINGNEILRDVQVDGESIPSFYGDATELHHGVAHDRTRVTLLATARASSASVEYSNTDADPAAADHQVDLVVGENTVTITVTRGSESRQVALKLNRAETTPGGWRADLDLDFLKKWRIKDPVGIWGDVSQVYVAERNGGTTETRVHRFTREGRWSGGAEFGATVSEEHNGLWSDGTTMWLVLGGPNRLEAADISPFKQNMGARTNLSADNADAAGLWGNSATYWVSDKVDEKLYAYKMSDRTRDADKAFSLHADNADPAGIWSDGDTMFVVDTDDDKLYAYKMSDRTRDADKAFSLHADNADPAGIWSDGDTMFVVDTDDDKLYAYKMSDRTRDANRDIDLLTANSDPRDIWGSGEAIWVVDETDEKAYAYSLISSDVPNLRATPGSRRVTLRWDNPGDTTIIRYQYRYRNTKRCRLEPGLAEHFRQPRRHHVFRGQRPDQRYRIHLSGASGVPGERRGVLRERGPGRVDSGRGQNRTLRPLSAFWPPVFAGEQDVSPPKG